MSSVVTGTRLPVLRRPLPLATLAPWIALFLLLFVYNIGFSYVGSGDTVPAELAPIAIFHGHGLDFREFVSGDLPYWFRLVRGDVRLQLSGVEFRAPPGRGRLDRDGPGSVPGGEMRRGNEPPDEFTGRQLDLRVADVSQAARLKVDVVVEAARRDHHPEKVDVEREGEAKSEEGDGGAARREDRPARGDENEIFGWSRSVEGEVEARAGIGPEGLVLPLRREPRPDVCRAIRWLRDCSRSGWRAVVEKPAGEATEHALAVELKVPNGRVRRLEPIRFRWKGGDQ